MSDVREMVTAELDVARDRLARSVAAVDALATLQQLAEQYSPASFCDVDTLRGRLPTEQRARFDVAVQTYTNTEVTSP